jgi:hypothetical protein
MKTNWYVDLKELMESKGDDFDKRICTLTEEQLRVEFDDGYGGVEGEPFTAWGEKYVYFPICYDGSEWVGCAPRNPCDEAMIHQGGG